MKHLIIPLLLAGSFVALTTTEASAVVCAAGVYRAGCVAAGPVVVAPRAVVVAPFTDNSNNNGSEYDGLRVKDGAIGRDGSGAS
ncbi:hypothetical protein [Bradyrhizobium sp.]|uniref:hypothetical protein n=1 Tax=Bradyrhizobium sp. TaxID=376 RepID=UPI003BAF9627